MPRPKQTQPSVDLHVYVHPSVAAELQLALYSNLEGKIPFGRMSAWVEQAIREKLARDTPKAKNDDRCEAKNDSRGDPAQEIEITVDSAKEERV